MLKRYKLKNYRFLLVIYLCALTIIGILVIGSAKESVQNKQIIGFVLGLFVMVAVSLIDYSFLLKFPWLYYLGGIVLMLAVKIPGLGHEVNGARRWIKLGESFTFQPSEMLKIILILFFAYFLMKYSENLNTVRVLGSSIILAGILLALILEQPDLSTTIAAAVIFVVLLFVAGLSYKIIVSVLAVVVPIAAVVLIYIIQKAQDEEFVEQNYQIKRILAWIYPTKYADNALQQQNAIMAIGSGKLWGKGLNNSEAVSMKNTGFIVEPQTDFIFAVVGEELGFIGCAAVILLLFLIVVECIYIGSKAKDLAGRLICCGMATLIGFQGFINLCVATGLFPNTGIPLPFVSYGLTSLVTLFAGMGLVLNVGLQAKKY